VSVLVHDPFNVAQDPRMPFLRNALDPRQALSQLKACCTGLNCHEAEITLESIKVTRHKPGRRCLIEYELGLEHRGQPSEVLIVLGKARAKGLDKKAHDLLQRFRGSGFGPESDDGISVPEPLGLVPEFRMWLQRKIPGVPLTELLLRPDGAKWARRAAEAAHKIHLANLPARRVHTMADELRILHECLGRVAEIKPRWAKRLDRVLAACDRLGASVPEPHPCGIHRDFYPAQVIATKPQRSTGQSSNGLLSPTLSSKGGEGEPRANQETRIWLIDFDLYCLGDPGLDIGNFIGHITEQRVREWGDARALAKQEQAMKKRFIELSGESCRAAIDCYTTLTLVRHIYLSTQFPKRRAFTPALLELCEQRLGK